MAEKAYIGVNGVAKEVEKIYVGVNGQAKKVVKGYIGVNGASKLFFEEIPTPPPTPIITPVEIRRGNQWSTGTTVNLPIYGSTQFYYIVLDLGETKTINSVKATYLVNEGFPTGQTFQYNSHYKRMDISNDGETWTNVVPEASVPFTLAGHARGEWEETGLSATGRYVRIEAWSFRAGASASGNRFYNESVELQGE